VRRKLKHYNLDAIISVGYRVNSKRGVRFRQWATGVLREHIVQGYTLNAQRLAERGVGEIEQAVGLLARTLTSNALVTDEGRAVLEVVQQYTRAWKLLLEYDEGRLAETPVKPVKPAADLSLNDARTVIARLREVLAKRGEATDLFGAERGNQLHGILGAIDQDLRRPAALFHGAGAGGSSSLLRHQRSSVRRRQQKDRHPALPGIPTA
jgi:hypothetical protein